MSIFPKRTLRDTVVTIHWNFNTAHLKNRSIYPHVRIGVTDPHGNTTILFDKQVLALPAIQQEPQSAVGQLLYLNKNTPLMILADYLSGRQKKEVLVEILKNIQSGRHYYFNYIIPQDAPLGKYSLISEILSEGNIRYSKTASDDFFYVEEVDIEPLGCVDEIYKTCITNRSPEPVPVKIIDYHPGKQIGPGQLHVFELAGNESKTISHNHPYAYLSYNEERELIALNPLQPKCLRNQQLLELVKNDGQEVYLLNANTEDAYTLTAVQSKIWLMADGITSRQEIRTGGLEKEYDEMLQQQLIKEII